MHHGIVLKRTIQYIKTPYSAAAQTVYYFDSAKRPINVDLWAAYDWWINQHHRTEFDWIPLPCLQQRDSYNCGLFAANRVAHYINPKKYPVLDPQACDNERLYMLAKILDRHESLSEVSLC
jgi:hypothetical protein